MALLSLLLLLLARSNADTLVTLEITDSYVQPLPASVYYTLLSYPRTATRYRPPRLPTS